MFNFQQVMNEFYGYKPKEDDAYGNSMKNSFQANMIQSGWDAQMAKGLAESQAALSMGAMSQAADLDLRNKSAIMEQEFNYGMESMGAQYDFQNTFADNQNERDIVQMGAKGEQDRKSLAATGLQNRLQTITSGEQERLTDTNRIGTAGKETRGIDTNKITTQGSQDRALTGKTGSEARLTEETKGTQERLTIGTQSDATVRSIGAQSDAQVRGIGATGDESVRGIGAQSDAQVRGIGAQSDADVRKIGVQGDDTRSTMTHGNRLEAKTRADQSKYSRSGARSF